MEFSETRFETEQQAMDSVAVELLKLNFGVRRGMSAMTVETFLKENDAQVI